MSYSTVIQQKRPVLREMLRKRISEMGQAAGKPLEFSDDMLNDLAITFTLGMLSGDTLPNAFAVAYQLVFAVDNEE